MILGYQRHLVYGRDLRTISSIEFVEPAAFYVSGPGGQCQIILYLSSNLDC